MGKIARLTVAILGAGMFLTACGGGGGGNSASVTTVSGVASKGPIGSGIVNVFALNSAGVKGAKLGTATTAADGSYSVSLGSYTGNVLVEVTGGSYKDEATGATITNTTLSAALTGASGSVKVAVTPLTDVAAQLAKQGDGSYPSSKIDQANAQVSAMIGVNIINTLPVDVTINPGSTANQDNLEYGMMLAAISQMIENGDAIDVADAVTRIKNDLADDNRLNSTGADMLTALNDFMTDPANLSGIATVDQTSLDNAITFIRDNPITPPAEYSSDLVKAKGLITDLRNTMLTVHNDSGVGVIGILDTPLTPIAEDLQANLEPELALAVNNIALVAAAVPQLVDGVNTIALSEGKSLVATLNEQAMTATFTLTASDSTVLGQGNISLTTTTINNEILPTAGHFNATFKTQSGSAVANLDYAGTFAANGSLTSVSLTGALTTPVLSVDFSEAGRKLTASFAQYPNAVDTMDIYPTKIYLSGQVTSKLARITGTFDIPSIIYNNITRDTVPTQVTIKGEFESLSNGVPTGTKLVGTLTGNWSNATQNIDAPDYLPLGKVQFEGKLAAASRPTIEVLLSVSHSSGTTVDMTAKYTRTNPDGSVIFLSGTGTTDTQTGIFTSTLTNQSGIQVEITVDDNQPAGEEFTGVILSAGGVKLADIDAQVEVPVIHYIDGYFETAI